jgi:hypothetical protein
MNSGELSVMSWNVRGLNDAAHRELVMETIMCEACGGVFTRN